MKLLRLQFSCWVIVLCMNAEAQIKKPLYFIYKTPVAIGKMKIDSVNRVIARIKDDETVFTVLDNAFRDFKGVILPIKKPLDEHSSLYITYSIGLPKEIVRTLKWNKGTRGPTASMIRHTDEFRTFFADTLLIIDTLRVSLRVANKQLSPAGYYFLATQKNGVQKRIPIVQQGSELMISRSLFTDTSQLYVPVVLRHTQWPSQLARCRVRFVDQADKTVIAETWQLIRDLNKDNSSVTEMELANCLQDLVQDQLGPIHIENLLYVIRQNL